MSPSPVHPTHNTLGITHEEAERMRNILAKFDSSPENKPQQIDLNNPPKVPYTHQEFPRLVYAAHYDHAFHSHPDNSHTEKVDMTLKVNSQDELDAALADGYQLEPPVAVASEEAVVEGVEVEEVPRKSRKKR